jgi:peptide/nickel transport system substrate-binding protein
VTPPNFDNHRKPAYGPLVVGPVFNNLVQFNLDKPDISPENIVGDLATKWEISPDGLVYTFTLASGVKWHDGSAFTADDVVYSLTKMADKARSSLWGDIPAFDKAEKVSDTTVKVTLKYASPSFLVNLAGPYSNIQSPKTATIDNKTAAFAMGTGPFKVKSFVSGQVMELVKNPDYFKKDAQGNKLPYLDGINIQIIANKAAAIDALVTGKMDGHGCFLYNDEVEWTRGLSQAPTVKATLYNPPGLALMWLNTVSAKLQEPRVRQALRMLLDKQQMSLAGYDAERWVNPNRTIFTSTYGLTPADMNKRIGTDVPYADRITAAKKLMADAGVTSLSLSLVTRNLPQQVKPVQWYADQLKRNLNVDLTINAQEATAARALRDSGQYDMYVDNPLLILGDPDEYRSWFETGGVNNFNKYSNKDADLLWASQSKQLDLAKRVADTQQIERLMIQDAWIFNISNSMYSAGWASYVKGWKDQNATYGNKLRMEYVWIDK